MKNLAFTILLTAMLSACSHNDEPVPEIYSQVAEISNGESNTCHLIYDAYGRIAQYDVTFQDETISCAYSYPSESLITIHTRHVIPLWENASIVREYDDEMLLEKGRAVVCNGIFTMYNVDGDKRSEVQKKYRHEFAYTSDNHLNVVKCTEWYKQGDGWADDKPWMWENYYIWENGNLTEVEDYDGNSKPAYTYKYAYSAISGVQNVVAIHFDRFQYYPLQLKGILGTQPANLISGIETLPSKGTPFETTYKYDITDSKISGYTETTNGVSENYSVNWVQ